MNATNEVFPNPTVKQVFLEARFPNLFYLESRIGPLQMEIMKEFPESKLIMEQQFRFMIGSPASGTKPADAKDAEGESSGASKIWQFASPAGVKLSLKSNSLLLASETYKSYDSPEAEHRFRDSIKFAIDNFLRLVPLPMFTRIGLRYVDHCPLPPSMEQFEEWYNSSFPLGRFPITDAIELQTVTRVKKSQNHHLIFRETFNTNEAVPFVLDFDGYAENVPAAEYLSVTDDLHTLISQEFKASIKQPVIEFMRAPRNGG